MLLGSQWGWFRANISISGLFWSLWPSIKELVRDVKEKLKNRSRAKT
jgi:hypothetical protein